MADDGRRMTDAEFRRLSAKIKAVYQEAYEDIYKKNLEFVKRHERREAQYRQMMDEGKITKTDFNMWMRGQVFQGKQWEAKRKQMEATLLNADQMAMDMINGSRVRVFADNANFIGYELEQHGRVDTSFGLYDINSVKRLLMEEPDLLPPRSVGKDESYKWYNKQIQGAVTQGIIQGEKLTDIAKRIGQLTGERCMNAMLRNARTMHTGAENAGRIEGMHQAQRLGIEVQKKWLATLDGHTRDAHRDLDGQVRDVDKPFDSSMGKIRFPGDATAFPGLVWNCRCTLTYVYPKYPDSMVQRRDNITGEVIEDMTYREWERMKRGEETPEPERELTPIDRIRDTIANHEGDWSLDEVQEIGRQLSDEVSKAYEDPMVKWHEINAQQTEIWKEIEAQKAQNSELNRLIKETDDKALKKQYRQELAEGRARRKELEAKISELSKQYWAVAKDDGRSTALQESLAQIRDMGGITDNNVRQYADLQAYPDATGRTMAATIEAMNCYPSSWLEHSQDHWHDLQPHWTTERAYYNTGTGEIRFNGDKSTNVHEMGHRFEQCVPGILQSEREFYARRTAGESLEWMGPGYQQDERTRKDNFENAYMGKDYGGQAYELVSMGFQYAFTDYGRLAKDPDMETWILGLLATM